MTPDFRAILLASIKRCDAVYEPDEATARTKFAALGCTVLGRYCDAGHQGIVHRDPDGQATITICGSRVNEGTLDEHAVDLFEDIDFTPTPFGIGSGMRVASGAVAGLDVFFAWAQSLIPCGEMIVVEGHSLGGQRTHLAPLFIPRSRLAQMIAWEPPKAANDVCYKLLSGLYDYTRITVINGRDPWAAWPWTCVTLVHPPGPILWLHDGIAEWTTREGWPGGEILASSDHYSDQIIRVIEALPV